MRNRQRILLKTSVSLDTNFSRIIRKFIGYFHDGATLLYLKNNSRDVLRVIILFGSAHSRGY